MHKKRDVYICVMQRGQEKGLIRSQSSFDRNFALISLDWHARTIKTNIEKLLFLVLHIMPIGIYVFMGLNPQKNIVSVVSP